MSDFRIVFIHGYTASHLADWYPNITPMLEEMSWDFEIPDLPGGRHPHAEDWLSKIHEVVAKSDKPLILVGHSLGTRTALLYLEKYKPKVEKVFLIAVFANRLENADRRSGEAYPDFFVHNIDIEEIKSLSKEFIVMHSKDDHSISFEQGVEIAEELEAKLLKYEDRDHFSNARNAEEIFSVLKKHIEN
jgi:serine hydrolase